MTVDSIQSRVIYHGNASATVFPVPFQYSQTESIRVVFTNAAGDSMELEHGRFGINVTASGTSITYPLTGSPIGFNTRLTIFRDTDQSQIVALKFGGAFNPEVLEYDVFDRTVMMVQEIQDEVDRSVKVAVDSEMTQQELQDNLFAASDNAIASASAAASSANAAANSAATATTQAQRAETEANRAQGEADRASEIAAGTWYKTSFFNKRASWAVETAIANGSTMTLPETYFPTRNHLMLFYNGILCELRSASSDATYQYSEIGTADVLSSTVTIHFAAQVGDRFDMLAVASGIVDSDALPLTPIDRGGTGATTAAAARTNLGVLASTGGTVSGNLTPNTASSRNLGSTSNKWNVYANNLTVSGTVEGIDAVLPGLVMAFSGTFGGTGNKFPINKKTGVVDLSYALCDGSTYTSPDGRSVTTPNLTTRFIKGSTVANAGQTGGGVISIGGTTLTAEQLPVHSHLQQMSNTTTTNIIDGISQGGTSPPGFRTAQYWYETGNTSSTGRVRSIYLLPSGYSTQAPAGASTRYGIAGDLYTSNSGSGSSHTHTVSNAEPAYYTLAYIIKL